MDTLFKIPKNHVQLYSDETNHKGWWTMEAPSPRAGMGL